MGQEPIDRIWGIILALVIVVAASGLLSVSNRLYMHESRRLGYERGAVDCLSVIVYNDRDFFLPDYCQREELIIYYPPQVCKTFFEKRSGCSREWRQHD